MATNGFNNGTLISGGGGGGGITSSIGPYAALPGSGTTAGDLYFCSDTRYTFRWSGSAWEAIFEGMQATLPATSGWTWMNQGGSTASTTLGALSLQFAGSPGTWRLYMRSVPAAPYTVTIRLKKIHGLLTNSNAGSADGLGVAFGDGTKFIAYYMLSQSASQGILLEKWNSTSSFSGSYNSNASNAPITAYGVFGLRPDAYFRIQDDNTDLKFYHSVDGVHWILFDTRSRTDFFTSGPTEIGLCFRDTGADGGLMYVWDWTVA